MALHGTIKVNGRTLMWWSATRLDPFKGHHEFHDYKIQAIWPDGDRLNLSEVISHRYSDGITALTARVMNWAEQHAPETPKHPIETAWGTRSES